MSKEKYPRDLKTTCYMMATKAMSGNTDVSRSTSDLCVVDREDKNNYIGNWVTGLGVFNIEFPKKTTRSLTEEEKDKFNGMLVKMGGYGTYIVQTKEIAIPTKAIEVVVKGGIFKFSEADKSGMRTVSCNKKAFKFEKCAILFLVVGKSMHLYPAGTEVLVSTVEVVSIK